MIVFVRNGDRVVARFTRDEPALLRSLAEQLVALLGERASVDPAGDLLYAQLGIGGSTSPSLDPALARLLPDAYRGDEEAASEHRRLTERGLVERKIANATTVITTLDLTPTVLDQPAVQSWLRCLTDLRLVLAARLQIEEDGDPGHGDEQHLAIYNWLGDLQGSLLAAIE